MGVLRGDFLMRCDVNVKRAAALGLGKNSASVIFILDYSLITCNYYMMLLLFLNYFCMRCFLHKIVQIYFIYDGLKSFKFITLEMLLIIPTQLFYRRRCCCCKILLIFIMILFIAI